MKTLIIEVSGGVVQEVYTNAEDLHVILIDWDTGESPGEEFAGGKMRPLPLSQLPSDTIHAVAVLAS